MNYFWIIFLNVIPNKNISNKTPPYYLKLEISFNILVSNEKVFIYMTNGMTKIYIKTCNWALLYTSGLRSTQYTSQ